MWFHDFSFNGILASQMGVVVETQAEYIRPAKRLTQWTVPGRPGKLTREEGEEAYETVLLSPQCWVKPGADAAAIGQWLQGTGLLILGSMPDYAYEARVINQIPFSRLFQGGGYMQFAPVFECQPFRLWAQGETDLVYTQPGTITNPGNIPARPRIRLLGSGDVLLQVGQAAQLSDLGGGIIIDSGLEDCLSLDESSLINDRLQGDFPLIPPGTWQVTWTGNVSQVTITPRWRWR